MKKVLSICFSGAIACAAVASAKAGNHEVGVHPDLLRELGNIADAFTAENTESPVTRVVIKRRDQTSKTLTPDAASQFAVKDIGICSERFPNPAQRYEIGDSNEMYILCQAPNYVQGSGVIDVNLYIVQENADNAKTLTDTYTGICPITDWDAWHIYGDAAIQQANDTLCGAKIAPGG